MVTIDRMKKKETSLHTMDLISLLPDPIVHHIMSFLTTSEVTRLSVLSKRFFSLWGSFPVIELDQKRFSRTYHQSGASVTNGFLDHVLNTVRLRTIINTVLSEFRVNADLETTLSTDERFDLAILLILANGIRCMELNLGFGKYRLPAGFASTSMNVLRFQGLRLDLSHLIQVCPSLRTVSLTSCKVLDHVNFSSETLTEIEFCSCRVKFIKIKARNLQLFVFSGEEEVVPKPCKIDVLQCENIAYLSLNDVLNDGRDWIEEHVHTLSKLKTFILNGCEDIESIRVWNDKLERVELSRCPLLTYIQLRATSLKSFDHKSDRLDSFCNITFVASSQHIKDLSIKGVSFITDQWLETQVAKMTRLEKLRLQDCNALKKIKVCHEKLQILELYSCNSLEEADIDTPQLVSFVYHGGSATFFTDQWLEAQLGNMTRLEKLSLKACNSLKKIKVCHEKLQILGIYSCIGLVEAEINTPELVSFAYNGDLIEFGKMVTRSSCKATLSMEPWIRYDNESFCRWRNMLSFFGHCKALKLICSNYKEVMIPKLHRERLVSPLYDLQHLEIQIESLKKIDRDLVDGLLWLSPLPKILHVSSASRSSSRLEMIIKFVYNDMIEGEEQEDNNPSCCETKRIKCWKHHLKRLEIRSSNVSPSEESSNLQTYFLTNTKTLDSLCFSLI